MNNSKKEKISKYAWSPSGSGHKLYPMELFFGEFILADGSRNSIRKSSEFAGDWGDPVTYAFSGDGFRSVPKAIDIIWYSIVEDKFYSAEAELPYQEIEELLKLPHYEKKGKPKYHYIIAGMAPCGGLAIWLEGLGIGTSVAWLYGEEIEVDFEDFCPDCRFNREEYAEWRPAQEAKAYENLQKNGLPDRTLFNNYMQRFNYRFTIKLENEDAVLEKIQTHSLSGEYNYNYSDDHLINAMHTKPRKIWITWRVGKIKYDGLFWTDENKIIDTFDKYYQTDVQKEGELVFEIGKDNNKFKIYLQDKNNDPDNPSSIVELLDEELQILVFKDEWEFYRNAGYNNREPGKWAD